ncbi:class I SAM-dependent methyltransferase [Lusitaniella coriacea LEGE 07157]|uniref:Class I SAM-dependent methyltransferase n=1 Tax=Lusitaniella coriacea LEGE 07157 TaxID=945747 RepID=A0A8J7JC46_9CYAN|nr:class I SAM-dependent methyltransferase [Lusitaniella coriacea]MBE9117370.1 class I SAM-dependent methyltransferase [Lusitaniella coriacea LEGE 07157]
MGFYSNVIFPRILDLSMSSSMLTPYRQQVLAETEGDVLEVGFGTGLNLPYYPSTVRKIVAVDPNPTMKRLAQKRIDASTIEVEFCQLSGESLPMNDNQFDCVVSTWTLCSIPNIQGALQEIRRVLKPQGRFFFVEHGVSPEPNVEVWQNRLNPLQQKIGDGCNLNRNMEKLINEAGFAIAHLDKLYMERSPKFLGYLYKGTAIAP